jgi:hypothetical protein
MLREQQIRDAVDRFVARVRQDTDGRLQALAGELLRAVDDPDDNSTGRLGAERAAIEVARALARGGQRARHDLMSTVVGAMRRLDEATTLRGILDALTDGAASETVRVAVLLVDGDLLRSYRHHGFDASGAPTDIPLAASPLLANVVMFREQSVIASAAPRAAAQLPAFLQVAPGHTALAIPLVVATQVVAVVFAEGPARVRSEPAEPVWAEHVEVLVRHTSARLENVTSLRMVEVLANRS